MVVVPAAEQGPAVRVINPDQVIVTKPSEVIQFTVTLRNSGAYPVAITGCEAGCSCTTPVGLPVTLAENSEYNLSFKLKAGDIEGSTIDQEIRIYTMPPIPNLVANVVSKVETSSAAASALE